MGKIKRLIATITLFGLLCACTAGCAGETPPGPAVTPDNEAVSSADRTPSSAEQEGLPSDEPAQEELPSSEPAQEESEPVPPEPLDIATTGGVVLVGTVEHDRAGWYFVPEQPLNVEYEYFLNNPSRYDAVTRIALFDSSNDGIEKLPYLGKTVTVEGTFRFYRDNFDTLYVLPYTIHIGKTVSESHAAPNLAPPDLTQSRYDPATPLPKYMEPMVNGGKYIYNAFMLSMETLELMGNDFTYFYCEFIDAFLSYRAECPCPSEEYAKMLSTVLYFEFPLYDVCAEPFEFVKHYDPAAKTVTIVYKYDKTAHQQQIDAFMAAAETFLSTASPEQTELERARNIYHELCTRVTYDESALTDFERKNAWYAYMNHTGVCVTFANVYNQLLTQVGIQATTAQCDYTRTMGHVWSMITIDGVRYFCDPTFELNVSQGSLYRYFGQNYAQRLSDGLGAGGITAGRYYPYAVDESMLSAEPVRF